MASIFEVTIQRRGEEGWPVVVEDHREGSLLPVRSEGRLQLEQEPLAVSAQEYGTVLGQAVFHDSIRDAFVRARSASADGVRVLVFVEDQQLKKWRWERLCAPVDGTRWDFLSLDQRALFSLYLPSLTDRSYPPIGRRDLRALVMVANPADPRGKYGLKDFGTTEAVARVQASLGTQIPSEVLARVPNAVGLPTLDELARRLTEGSYTILHLVCHGRYTPERDETRIYFEQPEADAATGQVLPEGVTGSELIDRLAKVSRLPYLIFLAACESSAPEAEQRLGGLAQRLVRELGIPVVIGMTERVTVVTANSLAEAFYRRLLSQEKKGEADRALVEAYAGLASRVDVNVPALYSRLGAQPLFSAAVDQPLTNAEIGNGLDKLESLLVERAPVLQARLAQIAQKIRLTLNTDPAALSPTARQEREQALSEVNEICQETVEISFHALAEGEPAPAYDARQPFRGMKPFRTGDREFFFGRELLIQKLENKLTEDNFLAVLGSSGSGKSSLVLAGLVPRLTGKTPGLQVVELTPGSLPLDQLRAHQTKLDPGRVLYVVDQFEEVFTQCRDEGQRRDFIAELLKLSKTTPVILTMRADFWGECAPYTELREHMQERQELVPPMTAPELRAAMEQQAAKVGLRFEADLSNTMLDEVAGEPAAMPLLQHALLELWKRRHGRWLRAEEYRALGGVKKAIAETADRLYNELSPNEQDRVRDIFLRLTQLDENMVLSEERRDTRRRVAIADLVPAGTDPSETRALTTRLADAVLVVTSRNEVTGEDEAEVAHEALLRHWARLRTWLDQDLANLRLRDSISEAAKEWEKNRKDESLLVHRGTRLEAGELLLKNNRLPLSGKEGAYLDACLSFEIREISTKVRTARRLRILAFSLAVFSLALAGFGAWAWTERNRAQSREAAVYASAYSDTDPELALLLSMQAISYAQTDQAIESLRAQVASPWRVTLVGHSKGVKLARWSADGTMILTTSWDSTVRLWDSETGKLIQEFDIDGDISDAEFIGVSRHLMVVSNTTVSIFRPDSNKPISALPMSSYFDYQSYGAAITPDGQLLLVVGEYGAVLLKLESGQVLASVGPSKGFTFYQTISAQSFSSDRETVTMLEGLGRSALFGAKPNTQYSLLWHWRMNQSTRIGPTHLEAFTSSFVDDPKVSPRILVASSDGKTELWNIVDGTMLLSDQVESMSDTVSGNVRVNAEADFSIGVWSQRDLLRYMRGHTGKINDLSLSPDGLRVASTSDDGTIRIWALPAHVSVRKETAKRVALSESGNRVLVAYDHAVEVREVSSGKVLQKLTNFNDFVEEIGFIGNDDSFYIQTIVEDIEFWRLGEASPYFKLASDASRSVGSSLVEAQGKIAVATIQQYGDKVAHLSVVSTKPEQIYEMSTSLPVHSLVISSDGTRLLIYHGYPGDTLECWNLRTKSPQFRVSVGRGHYTPEFRWSPNGRFIAVEALEVDHILILSGDDGKVLTSIPMDWNGTGPQAVPAFSQNSSLFAYVDGAGVLRVLRTDNWDHLIQVGGLDPRSSVAFSPDGLFLASTLASTANPNRSYSNIMEVSNGKTIALIPGTVVRFGDPKSTLVYVNEHNTISSVEIDALGSTEQLLKTAHGRVHRSLSYAERRRFGL
jgi:WD40 repeat protein/energy-coupling factor transporter ATP-binding protein EcfA2